LIEASAIDSVGASVAPLRVKPVAVVPLAPEVAWKPKLA
jgi:hypothetical protein